MKVSLNTKAHIVLCFIMYSDLILMLTRSVWNVDIWIYIMLYVNN